MIFKNMFNLFTALSFLLFALSNSEIGTAKVSNNSINWEHGVAFKNSKAIYFDPKRLTLPEMFISNKYLTSNIGKTIHAGKLIWLEDYLVVLDTKKSNIYSPILSTEKQFDYKIENQCLFIKERKEKSNWGKIYFRLIDKKSEHTSDGTIYYKVRLKCRWFNGVYEIGGPPG